MPELAGILIWLGMIGAIIGITCQYFYYVNKKNPARVSTGEVPGFPNNWRSLDSRPLK
jgi:hypothetical protein|tara:strand:- start:355 stop:528 length:174 start_codon:yes stop_codon:yes gene_type:complete